MSSREKSDARTSIPNCACNRRLSRPSPQPTSWTLAGRGCDRRDQSRQRGVEPRDHAPRDGIAHLILVHLVADEDAVLGAAVVGLRRGAHDILTLSVPDLPDSPAACAGLRAAAG